MEPKKKSEIKKYIEVLREKIEKHNELYYKKNQPIISDYEYDLLVKELKELEEKYPEFKDEISPTHTVGSDVLTEFIQRDHRQPMKSLDNTYSKEEVINWFNRIKKTITDEEINFVVELKIDGAGISITYENGKFVYALTRGDGKKGDDISHNIKTIKEIPLELNPLSKLSEGIVEIRGEVFMKKSVFNELNKERETIGEQLFANPRNAAAGSIKQLDSNICRHRKLNAYFYAIGFFEMNNIKSQKELLIELNKAGLPVQSNYKFCKNLDELLSAIDEFKEIKNKLDYEVDGLVIKVNDFEQQQKLGFTAKSPKFAIAYKYSTEKGIGKIHSIDFQVGRTGIITPVANFEPPIHLAGTNVTRATLHNFDYINELDIRINDYVYVEKAGEIIPKVIGVIKEKRTGIEKIVKPPAKCPDCNSEIIRFQDEVAYRCINPNCPAQIKERIVHFCSKNYGVNINIGPQTINKLYEKKFISDFADLYFLKFEQLLEIENFKEKSATNLLSSIEDSKNADFSDVLSGLGIPLVGKVTAELLANNFKNINNIMSAKEDEFLAIEGIGPVVAESIIKYFKQKEVQQIIEKLKKAGVNLSKEKKSKSGKLNGLIFVITGTLPSGRTRNELIKIIKENGGSVKSSITKDVNYLIAAEPSTSTKYKKAEELGIKIISEKEFEEMLAK